MGTAENQATCLEYKGASVCQGGFLRSRCWQREAAVHAVRESRAEGLGSPAGPSTAAQRR